MRPAFPSALFAQNAIYVFNWHPLLMVSAVVAETQGALPPAAWARWLAPPSMWKMRPGLGECTGLNAKQEQFGKRGMPERLREGRERGDGRVWFSARTFPRTFAPDANLVR